MDHFDIDAYTPAEMAKRVESAGVAKASLDLLTMFVLAMLAGAFIALGAMFYTFVVHNSSLSLGLTQLLGGLVFCLGLILVIVAGAELFTGNNLIVMAYVSGDIKLSQLLRNWIIVYAGNFAGALMMVFLVYFSNHWAFDDVGVKALMIANKKVSMPFSEALAKGVLCNVLVCLAVWLCFAGRSVTDKILAILFPISAFVALGFEHSVANMYFIPAGLLLSADTEVVSMMATSTDLTQLTLYGFLINNLLPVTIGNIIGGGFFVGIVYWFIYLRSHKA
ncbi:MAG: formate/nitrite transporter family protein [Gammaproteobacteria bacterium]|nr:formate/nitrite transporter family protein [Gammaproteobacteria bacterium]MCW8911354.1 formate/nitrite transporter family protein [Gammaproteobacteria bacterium]MCW9005477.1 formate/nitrite transporter family protein [Gammaproteobacteria bacterium]MCW9055305.1 formate/nitrite transporter family protein [Gammaproteobacteria bacterium]